MPRTRARFDLRRPLQTMLSDERPSATWPTALALVALCTFAATAQAALPARAPANAPSSEQVCAEAQAQPLKAQPPSGPLAARDLPNCDALALYYGFSGKPNYPAALQCAYYQRAHPNEHEGNPFAGPGILSMLYANGQGVDLDLDLAVRFTCEVTSAAVAEISGRLEHLEQLRTEGANETPFDLCDDATSGYMAGACANVQSKFRSVKRNQQLAALQTGWTPATKTAFAHLSQAEDAFAETRSREEVDLSGTARAMFSIDEAETLRDQVLVNLKDFKAGRIPAATAAQADQAEQEMNATLAQLKSLPADAWKFTTVTFEGIDKTQQTWLTTRDAWIAFARVAYPSLGDDRVRSRLTRQRAHQLRSLLKMLK